MDSIIYRDLNPEVAAKCGYFEPKESFKPLAGYPWKNNMVDIYDRVIYFPGSFGTFHEGHISLCKRALEKYPDAMLVIAPSNSDYTAEKYGVWSERASNKHRYQTIRKALSEAGIRAFIDIDPMLNHRCDQNFTDQLEAFLQNGVAEIGRMMQPPIILSGKDRSAFLVLNAHTDLVCVEWFDDTTGKSTSATENVIREKKNLILRCETKAEFDLFSAHFYDQYQTIRPLYLKDELLAAKAAAKRVKATHTNCKEYADLLPYIKVSRHFKNPLMNSVVQDDFDIPKGAVILDSDIYSGSTRDYIESKGAKLHAVIDLEAHQDKYELLDISDFHDPLFAYPFVDISSRCSMQAFDFDFHKRFNTFKECLNHA